MKLHLECIPCYLRQALEAIQMATDDKELQEKILRKCLITASKFNLSDSGFILHTKIQKVIKRMLQDSDPYREVKEKYNHIVLGLVDGLEEIVRKSEDRFETSLRISLAGNIIDFGPDVALSSEVVQEAIRKSLHQRLDESKVRLLKKSIGDAKKILFIGDNAGEIVLDRIFIENLPRDKITYAVRGGPALNDATMEDAEMSGMTDSVRVITSGLDMPAAVLDFCSDEFLSEYKKSDLIIAKGQGNYESLCDEEKNIFFLLKIKCPVVAGNFNGKYKLGDIVVDKINWQ
jgi:uncharacterized protein with ATP-grasp and redox domains